MRKLLYLFVCLMAVMWSCDDDNDSVFDKSPEERISAVLTEYKSKLTEGDGYWIAYYYGNAILMKFKADNTVEFTSTYNKGKDDRTISYRVGATQVPELSFENHSVFHAIYENNREAAEYEFLFDEIKDGQIDLISKTDLGDKKSNLTLFKAVPEDIDVFKEMKTAFEKMSFFKTLTVENSDYSAQVIAFPGELAFRAPTKEGGIQVTTNPFEISKDGLLFSPALTIDGVEVKYLAYDKDKNSFNGGVEGKKITISVSEEAPESGKGVLASFKTAINRSVKNSSITMSSMIPLLRKDLPSLYSVDIYSGRGFVVCFVKGGYGGFSSVNFNTHPDNKEQLLLTWDYGTLGALWKSVYYNAGGQMLLNFMLDPKGLYVAKYGLDSYILVSNSDPSKYLLFE